MNWRLGEGTTLHVLRRALRCCGYSKILFSCVLNAIIPSFGFFFFMLLKCSRDSVVCPTTRSESGPSPWPLTAWPREVDNHDQEKRGIRGWWYSWKEFTWTTISYLVNFWSRRSRKLNLLKFFYRHPSMEGHNIWLSYLHRVCLHNWGRELNGWANTWFYATGSDRGRRTGVGSLIQTGKRWN